MEDIRKQRGKAIAEQCVLTERESGVWVVPAQSNKGQYIVRLRTQGTEWPSCSCPDYELREMRCKHIYAVEAKLTMTTTEQHADGSVTVEAVSVTASRKTYRQDWPKYNAAQVNERRLFLSLLGDLCDTITEPALKNPTKGGRPPVPLRDAMYSACLKVYSLMSARRFSGELEEAQQEGFIRKAPHFNTVLNVFDRPEVTSILKGMIETSAAPLKSVETDFAVDSTGFATTSYSLWHDHKWGVTRREAKWVKAHICTGVKTNIITAANIDDQHANDCPQFPALVNTTAKGFTVKEVSADKAYLSLENFETVAGMGGQAFIAFKANSTGQIGGAFKKAYHYFQFAKDTDLAAYHKRSNIETTNSMVKRKFGDAVKAKNELAQKNEVYAKFVCHNICVLISEMYTLGIQAMFEPACTKTALGMPSCTLTHEFAGV